MYGFQGLHVGTSGVPATDFRVPATDSGCHGDRFPEHTGLDFRDHGTIIWQLRGRISRFKGTGSEVARTDFRANMSGFPGLRAPGFRG